MTQPDARRLFRAATLLAGATALVLTTGCFPSIIRPQPGAGSPPCRWDARSCPDRGNPQPQPQPPEPDTTRTPTQA